MEKYQHWLFFSSANDSAFCVTFDNTPICDITELQDAVSSLPAGLLSVFNSASIPHQCTSLKRAGSIFTVETF